MIVDLVRTTTADSLRLDGAFLAGHDLPSVASTVDALLCLPGVGGNFYASSLLERILPPVLELGVSVLWANTRGHDGLSMASTGTGPRKQGAAYEIVDECRYDVRAWVDFLVERGCRRVGIFGHSLGAIKAVYSQAHDPHDAVECVIAASPPRLSCAAFQQSEQSSLFREALASAEQSVAAGAPDDLISVRFPFPLLIRAGGYIDKYGPAERYNILRFANRVPSRLLFTYGERELDEGGIAFAGLPDAIGSLSPGPGQIDVSVIAGADHFYAGVQEQLAEAVATWLA